MDEVRQAETAAPQVPRQRGEQTAPTAPEKTAWAGWLVFGATMLIMVGAFQAVAGLTALFRSGYYLVPQADLLVSVDYTAWGWVHLAIGALAIAAGFGLFAGQTWARVATVALALVSAVVNLAFIAAYPLWSVLVIAFDVVIMYAVIVHGDELESAQR